MDEIVEIINFVNQKIDESNDRLLFEFGRIEDKLFYATKDMINKPEKKEIVVHDDCIEKILELIKKLIIKKRDYYMLITMEEGSPIVGPCLRIIVEGKYIEHLIMIYSNKYVDEVMLEKFCEENFIPPDSKKTI